MTWTPYRADDYLSFDAIEAWCRQAAAAFPGHVRVEEIGRSRHGRPLLLLTVGVLDGGEDRRPAFWLDGGTHAAEWAGVMSALYTVSRWLDALRAGDEATARRLAVETAYVVPCISPDGYQALHEGAPFLRSTLRPPPADRARVGLEPCDLDGDGAVRWMRWRSPAGPFVPDPDVPLLMRPRRLDDDPADAWFFCLEGTFLSWDGHRFVAAPLRFGHDLNRNFPAHWAPFEMFGMDGGTYPLSEPESRAVVDAFAARPHIAAAVSNHTYTGALLTQPYRADTPLDGPDLRLMERLARQAVEGTGYRVFRVHPDFSYDPKQVTVGVWSDTIATVFGVPGYTLELWDPFGFCGVDVPDPAGFFLDPDPALIRPVLARFCQTAANVEPWRPFEHPQLGPVEIGGIDYLRTVRNPPVQHLAEECERGFRVAERVRRALPAVDVAVRVIAEAADLHRVEVRLENRGFLSTGGLRYGEKLAGTPGVSACIEPGAGLTVVEGPPEQPLHHLDGWGAMQVLGAGHPIYPSLPGRGHRAVARWWLRGRGEASVTWRAGRGGAGRQAVRVGD